MNTFTLPQSVNWIHHGLAINNSNSICVYSSKLNLFVIKKANSGNVYEFDTQLIVKAHKVRVSGVIFFQFEKDGNICEYFASCGEDGVIQVWDPETLTLMFKCMLPNAEQKMVDLDVFLNTAVIVAVCENGSIVKYDVISNKATIFEVGVKIMNAHCIAACPHETNLVAIGAEYGLVVVYSLKDNGKIIHKVRPHNSNVLSLSWCPVPYNALQLQQSESDPIFDAESFKRSDSTLLLASISGDRTIYIFKAGTNGYCEVVVSLPSKPLHQTKSNLCNAMNGKVCCIRWIYPLMILASTEFGELVSINFEKEKSSIKKHINVRNGKFRQKSLVSYDVKLLHNQHKKFIPCIAVPSKCVAGTIPMWTISVDKTIIRYMYNSMQTKNILSLPTLSGSVYSLATSPVNPDWLAVGTGESKIYIWCISAKNHIDLTILSRNIQSKIMALAWHPVYEGLLAFGTGEGRVGIFDISQGSYYPTLFRLYHGKPIYKLCWLPYLDGKEGIEKYYLWALGNGEVLKYDMDNPKELPQNMKDIFFSEDETIKNKKLLHHQSDMCYGSDGNLLAFGLVDGQLCICSTNPYCLRHTIWDQRKTIMGLMFHPKVVNNCPNEESPYRNWLAVAAENITVYEVDPTCENVPQKVAYHDIHSERISEICWSPHVNGRLLSVSFDYTAVVWNAINQTIIACYNLHRGSVFCGIWHPFDQNLAITGSHDGTCRIWNIFKDTVDNVVKTGSANEKSKVNRKPVVSDCTVKQINKETGSSATSKANAKKDNNLSLFPTVKKDFEKCVHLDEIVKQLIDKHAKFKNDNNEVVSNNFDVQNGTNNEHDDGSLSSSITLSSSSKEIDKNISYTNLFGTEGELDNLVFQEEQTLEASGNSQSLILTQTRFNLKEKIQKAMSNNEVTEHMLALAPSVSPKLWKDACNVYIQQLIMADKILAAVNYMLALNRHKEAISLLCEKNYFKEAFLICRQCLKCESEVRDVALKLAQYYTKTGNLRLAAHTCLFLDDKSLAANTLVRGKSVTDICLGIKLMYCAEDVVRATELSVDCFRKLVGLRSWNDIASLIDQVETIRHLEPWYIIAKNLHTTKLTVRTVGDWLMGKNNLEPDNVQEILTVNSTDFDKLANDVPNNTSNIDTKQLLLHTSGHLTLFLIGWREKSRRLVALKHLLKAIECTYNYRIINGQTKRNIFNPILQIFMIIFPTGPEKLDYSRFDIDKEESCGDLLKSILSYLGDSVISWLIQFKVPTNTENEKLNHDEKEVEIDAYGEKETEIDSDVECGHYKSLMVDDIKLEKLKIFIDLFMEHILNASNVLYHQSITVLKSVEVQIAKAGNADILKSDRYLTELISRSGSVLENLKSASDATECILENELFKNAEATTECSDKLRNDDEVFLTNSHADNILTDQLNYTLDGNSEISPYIKSVVRKLTKNIDEYKLTFVSSPNPFYFYCILKDYLSQSKITSDLKDKLLCTLVKQASECHLFI